MTGSTKFESQAAYLDAATPEVRALLQLIQAEVERRIPDAQRCIAYNLPAYRLQRCFFYFAAFKNHIGVYPPVTDDARLIAETAAFRNEKGNLRFPLNPALPLDLIGRVAEALARQYAKP